mgnify:CR=1 FL=1
MPLGVGALDDGAAASGEEGLTLYRQERPDVIILDMNMPGLDGLQLAESLSRRSPGVPPPLIIFVTAHAEHALRAFELEALDYLTKPVRRERLQQALAKVQRLQRPATPATIATVPEVTFALARSVPSSSCKKYGVDAKLMAAPVLLKISTHSQFGSVEPGSYMISDISSPVVAGPAGTFPGFATSATLLSGVTALTGTLVTAPPRPLTLAAQFAPSW